MCRVPFSKTFLVCVRWYSRMPVFWIPCHAFLSNSIRILCLHKSQFRVLIMKPILLSRNCIHSVKCTLPAHSVRLQPVTYFIRLIRRSWRQLKEPLQGSVVTCCLGNVCWFVAATWLVEGTLCRHCRPHWFVACKGDGDNLKLNYVHLWWIISVFNVLPRNGLRTACTTYLSDNRTQWVDVYCRCKATGTVFHFAETTEQLSLVYCWSFSIGRMRSGRVFPQHVQRQLTAMSEVRYAWVIGSGRGRVACDVCCCRCVNVWKTLRSHRLLISYVDLCCCKLHVFRDVWRPASRVAEVASVLGCAALSLGEQFGSSYGSYCLHLDGYVQGCTSHGP
jgi:hypothetical protein